jgi:glycogen debranching enzyme
MLTLPREICRNLDAVLQHEWLVTNGLGSYASGTVAGANTRRYHGLLVAALRPPVARTVMVAKVDEEVEFDQRTFYLGTNEYQDGTIHPGGFVHLESFSLEDGLPVFLYRIGGPHHLLLEKRIWMEQGQHITYVRYRLLRQPRAPESLHPAEAPAEQQSGEYSLSAPNSLSDAASRSITLTVLPFTAYRDYHGQQYGNAEQHFAITPLQPTPDGQENGQEPLVGCTITAFEGASPFHLIGLSASTSAPVFTSIGVWYWRFLHRVERERGLPDTEDYYLPGAFRVHLALPKQSRTGDSRGEGENTFTLALTTEPPWDAAAHFMAPEQSLQRTQARQQAIKGNHQPGLSGRDEEFLQQLRLGADQFLVTRTSTASRQGARQTHPTILAGYHWFTDWSRDTMISLPGLMLATGRFQEARTLLETFARYLNRGMLPNRFPDSGEDLTDADYNTVDATLWYFHALDQYCRMSSDYTLLTRLFPALEEIIAWHQRGTRFNIHVDERDWLLFAGEQGVQLTWMDALVDGWVVTPRIGKPVEINALWYNALRLMEEWAASQGKDPLLYGNAAAHCRESFNRRFWYEPGKHLYDVVDGPEGDDPSLRPNQLFTLSLTHPILESSRWEPMLEMVTRHLFTSLGLRTLDQSHPNYRGHITGDRHARDGAYHQGTVWAWLIGPYLDARLRVYGSSDEAARLHEEERCRGMLEAFRDHLTQYGLGTISEIFDGDAPHTARGCIAQAWSVAEVLRLWCRCHRIIPAPTTAASPAGRVRSHRPRQDAHQR